MQPVAFDLETASANQLFTYGPGFVRIGGYSADGEQRTTTDPAELVAALDAAPWIYGHNIMGFDLLALAFYHGADWDALSAKALDTMILDRLDFPPEARDTGGSIDKYDLDHVCERRGVDGKTDDIRELAKRHGGYDQIPVDDPDYQAYLRGDVAALERLIDRIPRTAYGRREHAVQSILGRMTLNGFRVDVPLLNQRIGEGEARKAHALQILGHEYDLPLGRFEWSGRAKDKVEQWEDFDNPLATLEGRKWLQEVWEAFGVANPPVTDKGRLSTKAETLRELIAAEMLNPELVEILELVMTVTTIRTVYQTVDDHLVGDRVYPSINMGQASGRSSVTNPGLTVFGKRGDRFHERDIFIPDDDDWSVITCDLKQVDMRAIAGLCQDPNYMALFENGRDPHTEVAIQLFGSADYRQQTKPITHGSNYGLGRKKLINAGHDPRLVNKYFDESARMYPIMFAWRDEIREQAKSGFLDNGWGRKMKCDPQRVYTQAPALMGQGAAADILKECLLRMPRELRPYMRVTVHDEVVFCAPNRDIDEISHAVKDAMTFEWRGVPIECDLEGPDKSWGAVCDH